MPLGKPVTLRCQGPPGVDLYRLEQVGTKYHDLAVLFIPAMRETDAGCYRCSYQNGSSWSPASDQLELVTTGKGGGVGGWPQRLQGCLVLSVGPGRQGRMGIECPKSQAAGTRLASEALAPGTQFRGGAQKLYST